MIAGELLQSAIRSLTVAGIGTARLDALVLLEDITGRDRSWLLAHPEYELNPEHIRVLNEQISRRADHVPLAYIRGRTEFYGREFEVTEHTLEPRPESETMIELLKNFVQPPGSGQMLRIADAGSGTGCLGITAALELGDGTQVTFIDIDPETLTVARRNAEKYQIHGAFRQNDLFTEDDTPYDVVLANLPYVPDSFHINEAAMREPRIAIFGGHDGLDLYRRMFAQLQHRRQKPRFVFTEALPPQHEQLTSVATSHGYTLHTSDDFIQVFVPQSA